jgi:hypothetical protein
VLDINNQNQVLVGMSASDDGLYQLESSTDLDAWMVEGEFEDLDLEEQQPFQEDEFSGGAKFYRMREL